MVQFSEKLLFSYEIWKTGAFSGNQNQNKLKSILGKNYRINFSKHFTRPSRLLLSVHFVDLRLCGLYMLHVFTILLCFYHPSESTNCDLTGNITLILRIASSIFREGSVPFYKHDCSKNEEYRNNQNRCETYVMMQRLHRGCRVSWKSNQLWLIL